MNGPLSETDLLEAVAPLCATSGQAAPVALRQLAGGKNNRVFKLDLANGPSLVLKSYHVDPRDPRDRLAAEWAFLNHIWSRGVRSVPQPLARDVALHLGLYTLLQGRKLDAREIGQADIDQAAGFIVAANAEPRDVMALAPGSEACFSLGQHLETVTHRVKRLAVLDEATPHSDAAKVVVVERLTPAWTRVEEWIRSRAASEDIVLEGALSDQNLCVSPSDFGFHNALRDDTGQIGFLDFEYAGRDDPAKLVCDFFCCPEIPVPPAYKSGFIDSLAAGLAIDAEFQLRCELLFDAYRIKWACIALNDFLPVGAARREFASASARDVRCAQQLAKATAILEEIRLR